MIPRFVVFSCLAMTMACSFAPPKRTLFALPTSHYTEPLFPTYTPTLTATSTLTTSPSAPINSEEIEQYYGSPPAAHIIVNNSKQIAGIGTTSWIKSKKGDLTVQFHGDAFGIVTVAQPITVTSPLSATLVLPIHLPPSMLEYAVYPVDDSDLLWGNGSHEMETWKPTNQPLTSLPLKTQQTIIFDDISKGLHVLYIHAEWLGLGSVSYGFLLDIK